jgi:hypothetical protein
MMGKKAKRVEAYNTGLDAENHAAAMLADRGFSILGRRYRSRPAKSISSPQPGLICLSSKSKPDVRSRTPHGR